MLGRKKRGTIITTVKQAEKYNMLARRKFLGMFAATPLAAKAAADEIIAKQINLGGSGIAPRLPSSVGRAPLEYGMQEAGDSKKRYFTHEERLINASDWIRLFGVPDGLEKEFRGNSKWVGALDPDIATKRSWSMSVKIQEQRQRNYDRYVQALKDTGPITRTKSKLKDMLGYAWPF